MDFFSEDINLDMNHHDSNDNSPPLSNIASIQRTSQRRQRRRSNHLENHIENHLENHSIASFFGGLGDEHNFFSSNNTFPLTPFSLTLPPLPDRQTQPHNHNHNHNHNHQGSRRRLFEEAFNLEEGRGEVQTQTGRRRRENDNNSLIISPSISNLINDEEQIISNLIELDDNDRNGNRNRNRNINQNLNEGHRNNPILIDDDSVTTIDLTDDSQLPNSNENTFSVHRNFGRSQVESRAFSNLEYSFIIEFLINRERNERRGATPSTLRKLSKSKASEKDKEISCSVCLSDFEKGESLVTLKCTHKFHQKCVTKWLKKNASCPMCRQSV